MSFCNYVQNAQSNDSSKDVQEDRRTEERHDQQDSDCKSLNRSF
jgi:hypothetical protein